MADAVKVPAVKVHFKAVGGAPIMKKNAFKINGAESFGKVSYSALMRVALPWRGNMYSSDFRKTKRDFARSDCWVSSKNAETWGRR